MSNPFYRILVPFYNPDPQYVFNDANKTAEQNKADAVAKVTDMLNQNPSLQPLLEEVNQVWQYKASVQVSASQPDDDSDTSSSGSSDSSSTTDSTDNSSDSGASNSSQ